MLYQPRAGFIVLSLLLFVPVGFSESADSSSLSLPKALANTLRFHPSLQASDHRREASAARVEQSSTFLNPRLEISAEEMGRDNQGLDQASYEVILSQPLESPALRKGRRLESEAELTQREYEHELRERQLLHETIVQYVDAAIASAEVMLARDSLDLANQTLAAVQKRIEAGKAAPPQRDRVQITQAQASLDLKIAQQNARATHKRLSSMWGLPPESFHLPPDALSMDAIVQSESNGSKGDHPEVSSLEAAIRVGEAQVHLSQALVWPELDLFAGWQHFEEDDTQSYIVGIQVPLPLWNRNRSSKQVAQFETQARMADLQAKRLELEADLTKALSAFENALEQEQTFSSSMIPIAERHLNAVSISYREGRSGLLDFLDANQLLLHLRSERLAARKELYLALADLHYTTPLSFPPFQPQETPNAP